MVHALRAPGSVGRGGSFSTCRRTRCDWVVSESGRPQRRRHHICNGEVALARVELSALAGLRSGWLRVSEARSCDAASDSGDAASDASCAGVAVTLREEAAVAVDLEQHA